MVNRASKVERHPNSDTLSPKINTPPCKIENSAHQNDANLGENPNKDTKLDVNLHSNDANLRSRVDSTENCCENSTNYTDSSTEFGEKVQNSNSDTSKNILDPLSVINTQHNMETSASSSSNNEEELVFSKLFPNVSVEKLKEDKLFSLFSSHNGKNLTISDLYTNYLLLISALSDDFAKKSLVSLQNKLLSPGSLGSSEKSSEIFFTKEQVLKMTPEQISQNYNIIRKSQQKW